MTVGACISRSLRFGRQEAAAEQARRGVPAVAPAVPGPVNPPAPGVVGAGPQVALPAGPRAPTNWVAMQDVGMHKRGDGMDRQRDFFPMPMVGCLGAGFEHVSEATCCSIQV